MRFLQPAILLISVLTSLCAFSQNDTLDDKIFQKVEIEASYPGGDQAWRTYLSKNLNADVPIKNSAPNGQYTVWVQFVVSKDGSLSEVLALTKMGYGMEGEVIRIIRQSGKWSPAHQDGRNVKAYRKQPVTFVVMDESFDIKSKKPYVLYSNVDNELTVEVDRVKNEDLQLTIQHGRIIRGADGKFIARVTKAGRVIIDIYNIKKDKKVGSASFEVIESPNISQQQ